VGTEKSFHPELYSLRAAAFAVIFGHHFLASYLGGFARLTHDGVASRVVMALVDSCSVGLDMFFCLSSFLITSQLVREFDAHGHLNVGRFLARRSLRIFPLYFGFLALTVFIVPRLIPGEHLSGVYLSAFCFFGANWLCAFNGYPASVSAPLWSVSAEQQFYLVWSALIAFLSPRRVVPLALCGLGLATVARITVLHLGLPHPAIWANTFARLDPIALGALCAMFVRQKRWRPGQGLRTSILITGLSVPPLLIFILGPTVYHGPWSVLFYPCVALASACVLAGTYRENKAKHPAVLVYLGRISYGLFIFHMLAIQIVRTVQHFLVPHVQGWQMKLALCAGSMALALGLTVALAALSYRYFETPFLALKARFSIPKTHPPAPATSLASTPMGPGFSVPRTLRTGRA